MAKDGVLSVESDWLPPEELRRLLDERRTEFPAVAVTADKSTDRAIDPAVAVALITGATTLLAPFLTKLAERIFAAEPKSAVTIGGAGESVEVLITPSIPADERERLLDAALSAGATRVRIGLEPSTG